MKKKGILNAALLKGLAEARHGDGIAVLDVGMPIPNDCAYIDLALIRGIPSLLDTVKAILGEVVVEKFDVFAPMMKANPEMYAALCELMPTQEKGEIPGGEPFADALRKAKVIIRTAEYGRCCNMILYSASGLDVYYEKFNIEVE
ncbi:MAG: RbsD/FucU domain-containing protein [Christensenellaceae bacterium]|jgi:D-ribose pyranase